MYPDADLPVIQLSINALKPLEYHFELGTKLASLRHRGIMVVGSGNVVHNLGRLQWDKPDAAFDWNERFDEAVVQQLSDQPAELLRLLEHPDYRAAVPTPDHFIPLIYLAGMAAQQSLPLDALVRGYSMGSISMTCYGLEARTELARAYAEDAATMPAGVPADQSNI